MFSFTQPTRMMNFVSDVESERKKLAFSDKFIFAARERR